MQDRTLYSIQESRRLLGGISRNMIYQLLRTGRLASVVIGSRRLISAEAIADLIERSTTTVSPSLRAHSDGPRRRSRSRCLSVHPPLFAPALGLVTRRKVRILLGNMRAYGVTSDERPLRSLQWSYSNGGRPS